MWTRKINAPAWIIAVVAVWYVALCSLHLSQQRPLWHDEAAVFESIEHYSPGQMFGQALRAVQVFPRVYLFLIQQFARVFDFHLLALRLPSFLCMLAGFVLWLKIAREGIRDRWLYLAFVCSWPASGLLLYYAAELKQYSMDVLIAAVFCWFLTRQDDLRRKADPRYGWMLAGLPVLGLLSYPAFMLMLLPLYNLVRASISCKPCRKHLAVYALSLLVCLGLAWQFDVRLRPVAVVSQGFSDYFISFASAGEFFRSLGEGINNLFSRWFVEYPKYFKSLTRIFTGFGLIYLFAGFFRNRKKEKGFLGSLDTTALPLFLVMFFVGCLRKYPFTVPRTSLFYAPIVLYLTVQGIDLVARVHPWLRRFFLALYFVFLGFLIVMQSTLAFWGRLSFYPTLW